MHRSTWIPTGRLRACAVTFLALAVFATPSTAKKNDPDVDLSFRPQQAVAAAVADLSHEMLKTPAELRVTDDRPGEDPSEIGWRTDDDDRKHTLRAVDDVGPFVAGALEELANEWDLRTKDGSGLTLAVILTRFKAQETNQAVGATYNANCRLSAELKRGGKELWSGTATGDATRYGKKFSNDNVNEVLSDALLEAFADLLSNGGLHRAWPDK